MSINKPVLRNNCKGFTVTINTTMDLISSPNAYCIYHYLISKPNNWQVREKDLMARFGKGRDWVRKGKSELKELGLYETVIVRNEKGVIVSNEVHIHPEPMTNRPPENPTDGKPDRRENNPHTKERHIQKKENKNITVSEVNTSPATAKSCSEKVIQQYIDAWNRKQESLGDRKLPVVRKVSDKHRAYCRRLAKEGWTPEKFASYLDNLFKTHPKWVFGKWQTESGNTRTNNFLTLCSWTNICRVINGEL